MKRTWLSIFALVFAISAACAQVPNVGGAGVPNSSGSGGGGSPTGAAGGSLTGTYPNPGLNLAGTNTGILPTANGGVPQGAWTSFTPSPSCGTATFTVTTAHFQQLAPRSTLIEFDITVTAIGTCNSSTGNLSLTLPNTTASGGSLIGYDFVGGLSMMCIVLGASPIAVCRSGTALISGSLLTNSHFIISAVYENQ